MSVFKCRRFPDGVAYIRTRRGDVVEFVDGRAEVDDPEVAEALRSGVLPVFGVVEVGEGAAPRHSAAQAPASPGDERPPSVRAPKADWVAYVARVHNVPSEEADAMNKADLIKAYGRG